MPLELRYRIVDVFTDRPLSGNALCVVLDPCPPDQMQALAREVNLSETTFVTVQAPDRYDVRIFTPFDELPFAGHPTLGTAWVLGPGHWTQTSAGATVTVEADAGGARMSQPDPELERLDPVPVAAALGLGGSSGAFRSTAGGTTHLLVLTDAPLEALVPDMAAASALAARHGATGLGVARRIGDTALHVRLWVPGRFEDPGTGSAAGPLAVLARQEWGIDGEVTIRQGDEVGRPCRIRASGRAGAVQVGGAVVGCAAGRFTL